MQQLHHSKSVQLEYTLDAERRSRELQAQHAALNLSPNSFSPLSGTLHVRHLFYRKLATIRLYGFRNDFDYIYTSTDFLISPDGSCFAMNAICSDGSHEFYILAVISISTGQVVAHQRNARFYSFSNDGKTLVFSNNRFGPGNDKTHRQKANVTSNPDLEGTDFHIPSSDDRTFDYTIAQNLLCVLERGRRRTDFASSANIVWVNEGRRVALPGILEPCRDMFFAKHNTLIIALYDDQMRIWSTTSGVLLKSFDLPRDVMEQLDSEWPVALSGDGLHLAFFVKYSRLSGNCRITSSKLIEAALTFPANDTLRLIINS